MLQLKLNKKILEMITTKKGTKYFQEIKKEMLKIVDELYWADDDTGKSMISFINEFFDQFYHYETYSDEEILNQRCGESNKISLNDSYFPPPWNINEHPEKTEGWIEFQKDMKKNPQFYKFEN